MHAWRRDGENRGVDAGWIVTQLEEDGRGGDVRNGEAGAGVAVGYGYGVGETRRRGDLLEKEEVFSCDVARLGGLVGALEKCEGGQPDEGDERKPITGGRCDVILFGCVVERLIGLRCSLSLGVRFGLRVVTVALAGGGIDGPHPKCSEGAGAEGTKRIEGGDYCVGVLQKKTA